MDVSVGYSSDNLASWLSNDHVTDNVT